MTTILRRTGVVGLVVALLLAIAGVASAHTPKTDVSCTTGVHLTGTSYNTGVTNTYTLTLTPAAQTATIGAANGIVLTGTFGATLDKTIPIPGDAQTYLWTTQITAGDDPDNTHGFSPSQSGSVGPCGTQPPAQQLSRDVNDTPDCTAGTITVEHQVATETFTFDYTTNTWVGVWGPYITTNTWLIPIPAGTCPTTPPPPTHHHHAKQHGSIHWMAFPSCQQSVRWVKVVSKTGVDHYTLTHGANRQRWTLNVWMHKHWAIRADLLHKTGPWVHHTKAVIKLRKVGSMCTPPHHGSGLAAS